MDIKSKISEGVVIAGVPVVAYWLAYVYQIGLCKFYEIPNEFIEVNLHGFFVCLIAISSSFGIFLAVSDPIFGLYRSIPRVLAGIFRRIGTTLIVLFSMSYIYKASINSILWILGAFVVPFILIEFVLPIFTQKGKQTYIEKLEAQEKIEFERESITDVIAKKIGFSMYAAIFYFALFSVLVAFVGSSEARNASKFMVSSDGNHIVLKKYGENFVVAELNKEKKTITPRFRIEKIDSSFGEFSYEKIGPLTVEEIKN